MKKLVDLYQVADVVCQDCNGCDYLDCPYDCDFIKIILDLGEEIVRCGECDCYSNGVCRYYGKEKTPNGYCNTGFKKI